MSILTYKAILWRLVVKLAFTSYLGFNTLTYKKCTFTYYWLIRLFSCCTFDVKLKSQKHIKP